jgi:hypothetical protein
MGQLHNVELVPSQSIAREWVAEKPEVGREVVGQFETRPLPGREVVSSFEKSVALMAAYAAKPRAKRPIRG